MGVRTRRPITYWHLAAFLIIGFIVGMGIGYTGGYGHCIETIWNIFQNTDFDRLQEMIRRFAEYYDGF